MAAAAVFVAAQIAGWAIWVRLRRRRRQACAWRGTTVPWVSGLAGTRGHLASRLLSSWRGAEEAESWLCDVEEILLTSDVGVGATKALLDSLHGNVRGLTSVDAVRDYLRAEVADLLGGVVAHSDPPQKPKVVLVVGVNGVGKTTTIGKLGEMYRRQGKSVLFVAGDTFRAAASEQLARWAERVKADIVQHRPGGDPSAVVFDGVKAGLARGVDVVIIDTAGRLHVKANLMQELKKIGRTIGHQIDGAPHEVLLVIDATTGQNAVQQARVFHEAVPVTGVVLAKIDGTAKGGVALAIRKELGLPIRYIGLGEGAADLAEFDADAFAAALFAGSP